MRNSQEQELTEIAREAVERGAVRKVTIVHNSGLTTKLKAPVNPTTSTDDTPFRLKDIHHALLAVMTAESQTAKSLAHKAGYRSLPRVYEALRGLEAAGRIRHCPEGYCLNPEQPGQN